MARQASEKERAKDLPTYKDNDFLNDGRVICVGPEKREALMKTIQADTEVSWSTCCKSLFLSFAHLTQLYHKSSVCRSVKFTQHQKDAHL